MEDKKEEDKIKNYKLIKREEGKPCYMKKDKYILHYCQKLKNGNIIY